jgi:hypothetical protein
LYTKFRHKKDDKAIEKDAFGKCSREDEGKSEANAYESLAT